MRQFADARPCEECSTPFRPRRDSLKAGGGRFCSVRCACRFNGRLPRVFRPERPEIRTPADVRFWRHVDKSGDCWLWTGAVKENGYGTPFEAGTMRNSRRVTPHRFSYELANGTIPDGAEVCHRCDERRCVRPEHLVLGTHAANMADMVAKGRHVVARGSAMKPAQREQAIALRRSGEKAKDVAARFGVKKNTIDKLMVRAKSRGDAAAIKGDCWVTRVRR